MAQGGADKPASISEGVSATRRIFRPRDSKRTPARPRRMPSFVVSCQSAKLETNHVGGAEGALATADFAGSGVVTRAGAGFGVDEHPAITMQDVRHLARRVREELPEL